MPSSDFSWKWWNAGRLRFNLIMLTMLVIKLIMYKVLDAKIFYPPLVFIEPVALLFLNMFFAIGLYYEALVILISKKELKEKTRIMVKKLTVIPLLFLYSLYSVWDFFYSI